MSATSSPSATPPSPLAAPPSTAAATRAAPSTPARADDAAIRSLAAAIHRELREGLEPEDVVRLASELLGRVVDELRERRTTHDRSETAPR